MIKVQTGYKIAVPVAIKVIDFEWAAAVGKGCYSLHLNTKIDYPGTLGSLIETSHDVDMVVRCQDHIHGVVGLAQKKTTI